MCGAHENSTSLCCPQTLKSHQTTQLRVITLRVFYSAPLLQEAVVKLLEEICHILPAAYRNQCETVIDKVSRTVLDAILAYATPQAICHLMHFCKGEETPLVGQFVLPCFYCSDCDYLLNLSYVGQDLQRPGCPLICLVHALYLKSLSADLIWHNTIVTTASFMHYSTI